MSTERDAAGHVLCPTCKGPYLDGAHGFTDCIAVLKAEIAKLQKMNEELRGQIDDARSWT